MLEYIHLINFQKYVDYTYKFNSGVSYITGVNGCGKSTILRAIMWVATNYGNSSASYIRTYNDDGSLCSAKEVSAEIGVDGHIVKRVYSSSKNEYYVDGLKITGFGKNVPEEVASIFKMSALNYSEQFSPLFLLNDSGNSLATELGEVASLEEMDELSDSVNASIRAKNTEVENLEESCNVLDKKIDAVCTYHSALNDMDSELLKEIADYTKKEKELFELTNICSQLNNKKDLTSLKDRIDAFTPDSTLFEEDSYLADLIYVSDKLKEIPPVSQSIIDSLICDINMSDFEMEDIGELENILNSMRVIDEDNTKDTNELVSITNQLSEFKVCPFCGNNVGEHKCQN